jgi:signal transduction histidine kinase
MNSPGGSVSLHLRNQSGVKGHGMGLRIMRYRAQCIGGWCDVQPGPTHCAIVHCRVPLEAQPSVSRIS